MIEQLRIKCPSCGIILEVSNSRHEAVKRITCPYCQKQLAVDFQEYDQSAVPPKPLGSLYEGEMRIALCEGINQLSLPDFDYVEVKVTRLKDGSSKCIVRALTAEHPVLVNGEPLQMGDEVVLAVGDEISVGKSVLIYGKPGKPAVKPEPAPEPLMKPAGGNSQPRIPKWAIGLAALLIALVAVWYCWPDKKEKVLPRVVQERIADSVGIKKASLKNTAHSQADSTKKKVGKAVTKEVSPKDLSDYELEQRAMNGDMVAQYELGNRLVHRSGSNNVIRGIKYLKLASRQGSSKAQSVLNKAVAALQSKADSGDSVAYNILMSIN